MRRITGRRLLPSSIDYEERLLKSIYPIQRKPESEEAKAKRVEQVRQNKIVVHAIKARPCVDCHRKFPPDVMDFDHVRGQKRFGIGRCYGLPILRILEEIKKCDLVCANCHRIRTMRRREESKRQVGTGYAPIQDTGQKNNDIVL